MGLIERRTGAQLPTKKDRWPHIFAVYSRSMKATELRGRKCSAASAPCGQLQWDEQKGKSAVLQAFCPSRWRKGWEYEWEGRRKRFRRWKLAVKLWHKHWMNVNKECRGDVKSRGPKAHWCHMFWGGGGICSRLSSSLPWFGPGLTSNESKHINLSSVNNI